MSVKYAYNSASSHALLTCELIGGLQVGADVSFY